MKPRGWFFGLAGTVAHYALEDSHNVSVDGNAILRDEPWIAGPHAGIVALCENCRAYVRQVTTTPRLEVSHG
jgi:hypothetical protein